VSYVSKMAIILVIIMCSIQQLMAAVIVAMLRLGMKKVFVRHIQPSIICRLS
jgi:hypothetical protein